MRWVICSWRGASESSVATFVPDYGIRLIRPGVTPVDIIFTQVGSGAARHKPTVMLNP